MSRSLGLAGGERKYRKEKKGFFSLVGETL